MHKVRRIVGVFATLTTLGCEASLCAFPQFAGQCDGQIGLEAIKPSDSIDRVEKTATLRLAVSPGDISPRETQFRIWIEGGGISQGASAALAPMLAQSGPLPISLGDLLPRPDQFACGPATFYLHAGRTDTAVTVPSLTPESDRESALYLQHGRVDLRIIDYRPPLAQLSAQTAFNLIRVYDTYSGIAIRGNQTTGFSIISNKIKNNDVPNTAIAMAYTIPKTDPSAEETFKLFVGDFSSTGSSGTPDRSLVIGSDSLGNSQVFSCPLLTKLPTPPENPQSPADGCRPAVSPYDKLGMDLKFRSLAIDPRGSYFAVVSSTGTLSVFSWNEAKLEAKRLNLPQITDSSFTQVAIGKVNADEAMDLIALRNTVEPLVLLRGADEVAFQEDAATEKSLGAQVPPALSLANPGTRLALGNIRCAARAMVMVGSQSQVAALVPDDTTGANGYRVSSYSLPTPFGTAAIRALGLVDLKGELANSAPDSYVDTLVVLQAGDKVSVYDMISQ